MDKKIICSQYYLVIGDQGIIECTCPQGISYHAQKLSINVQEKTELQIIYQVDTHLDMTIHIHPRTQIDLIETKTMNSKAVLHKKIAIDQDAQVRIFSENLYHNEESIQCYETVYLKENAMCSYGYAELSDGSVEGCYHYHLDGQGAHLNVRTAILAKETDKKKFEISIYHHQPHTYGRMDNYGVTKDNSHLTIDGIGTIEKGNHGSASHQTNKIMVFDENCVAKANPYLYIDDYDVKASHAAGVGKMDEEHLYYLQSRGLTKKEAMQLITYGYLNPVINTVQNEKVKERFEKALLKVGD